MLIQKMSDYRRGDVVRDVGDDLEGATPLSPPCIRGENLEIQDILMDDFEVFCSGELNFKAGDKIVVDFEGFDVSGVLDEFFCQGSPSGAHFNY